MFIATSRVTAQGQISIPAEVRRRMNVRAGTELVWNLLENGEMTIRPKRHTLSDVQEILNAPGLPNIHATDDEITRARGEFLAHRWKRFERQER